MKIIKTPEQLAIYRKSINGKIGFVATMGALHNGHLSLIQKSIKENDITIVSIYINPTQFLPNEDLDKYPKKTEADLKICSLAKVDAVFLPTNHDMYFKDEPQISAPKYPGYILEGFQRPGHFDGVLRIVLKLFNLVAPHNAYFGKKDAQQVFLVQNMVKTLFLPINIIPCEIIREDNGLALSSRNVYLNNEEKKQALSISKALRQASKLIIKNILNANVIKEEVLKILEPLKVDYVAIVSRDFNEIEEIEISNTIILIAARVGKTRLIDNIWI